jgi:hypothetical protein
MRLRFFIPAIAQDVPEFVAELVGEFRPVIGPDVDDDPRYSGMVVMKPYCGCSALVTIDANFVWLSVGEKLDSIQADLAHSREHAEHCVFGGGLPVTA